MNKTWIQIWSNAYN